MLSWSCISETKGRISRFFSVTIDELIGSEEIIAAARDENEDTIRRYARLICGLLDVLPALLLFLPVFGNGPDAREAVSLLALTGIRHWIRGLFSVLILLTLLNGILEAVLCRAESPRVSRIDMIAGMALTAVCTAVFILTRQPYAGILCFAVLLIKGIVTWRIGRGGMTRPGRGAGK